MLKEYVMDYLTNGFKKNGVPKELRKRGKIFYGMDDASIFSLLFAVKHSLAGIQSLATLPEQSLSEIILDAKNFIFSDKRQHSVQVGLQSRTPFVCTDLEYEEIRKVLPSLTDGKNKASFCAYTSSKHALLQIGERLSAYKGTQEPFTKDSEIPLYRYAYLLVNASNYSKQGIAFNEVILEETDTIKAVISDLQSTDRSDSKGQLLPKLSKSVTTEEFLDVLKTELTNKRAEPSVISNRLVRYDNGDIKDLGELTLVNHIIKNLNEKVAHRTNAATNLNAALSSTSTIIIPPTASASQTSLSSVTTSTTVAEIHVNNAAQIKKEAAKTL